MVYLTSWDDFVEKSVQLFRADSETTRYVFKYRHCNGKLVLKVTDNKEVLHFCSLLLVSGCCESRDFCDTPDGSITLMPPQFLKAIMVYGFPFSAADLSEASGKEHIEAQPAKKGRGWKQ
ncbi:hypothetical protein ACH5RR_020238 [Cinchona calisaya]|uniref:SRP9 domain-containing protein n=1 Tax=Cinchona calisaya TaxID=153742 RepID=A0ABD2ZDU7_9GENT